MTLERLGRFDPRVALLALLCFAVALGVTLMIVPRARPSALTVIGGESAGQLPVAITVEPPGETTCGPEMMADPIGPSSGFASSASLGDLRLADAQSARTVASDPRQGDTERNEALNRLWALRDPSLAVLLWSIVARNDESERFRAFCLQFIHRQLLVRDDATVRDRLWALVGQDRHRQVRRQALHTLGRVGDPRGLAAMERLVRDGGPAEALDLAVREVARRGRCDLLPAVRRLLGHSDGAVQVAAVNVLGIMKDVPSRTAIDELRLTGDSQLRAVAKAALERIDGRAPP